MRPYLLGPEHGYKLLATGQTTQRDSELDDGNYQKGKVKAYAASGSGTTNIDLAHYTATAGEIDFNNGTTTINDVSAGLAIFKTNDVIMTDAPNNLGPFTVTTGNVAATITCTGATFTTETPAGAITIYKREAHTDVVALDLNTKLMWTRDVAGKMGPASDGLMPWTGQLYDVFAYCAAAITATLAGYADWRVPNALEFMSLINNEVGLLDTAAFPAYPAVIGWMSTSLAISPADNAIGIDAAWPIMYFYAKTENHVVLLVRGP